MKITLISEMDEKHPINNDASSISSKISHILEDRFLSSRARTLDGKLYVYFFLIIFLIIQISKNCQKVYLLGKMNL